ncbi:hypothetical protein DEJ50_24325 [Streptomyces venezuelae]|uniref:Large membrane protein n=1 Tax=Streptomyces venezuelae TaxID=54571 RepID=A0A5P2DB34_STRVZ|nr:hypothetical protein [Streptomyces venezuelae]QES50481.1 hypothetical protein DEJ50_24325 [Streptomyces venezuelae]
MTSEQPGTPETSRTTARRRPFAVVGAVAAAVLLAGGGTAYWAATAHGGDERPAAVAARDAAAGSAAPSPGPTPPPGIAPGEPDPSGGSVVYEAKGPLPEGPASAPVFKAAGEVTEAEVARLAAALGVEGKPQLSGAMWQVGTVRDGGGPRLQVNRQAPGTWSFSRAQPAGGDNCVRGKDTCGPATLPEGPGGGGGGAGTPVSEEAAKAAAAPVLAAAGQQGARLDARLLQGAVRVVVADPVVGGLPTQGWSSRISVGADGTVASGSGELKAPERSGERPVVGASAALDRLNERSRGWQSTGPSACATPVPLDGDAAGSTDSVPCNPDPRPIKPPRTETVERAALGLTATTVDGVRGLEPAWLFEVAGRGGGPGHTVVQPAGAEQKEQPKGRTVPGFSYDVNDRKLTVHFWGGVCSTYALEVQEHPETVSVRITDTPKEPGRACILIAQEMSLSATLAEPLGSRKVVDATNGQQLPRA